MRAIKVLKDAQTSIWTVQLCRPDRLNALSEEMGEELVSLFEDASKTTSSCRGVLLKGHARAFSSGRDLKASREHDATQARRYLDLAVGSVLSLLSCEVPTAVAVQGHCIGWGMEIAMAADVRFVDDTVKFRLPETSLGLFPGAGGVVLLPRLIGEARAKEIIFSAREVASHEAHEIGLAIRVEDCEASAMRFLKRCTGNAPLALRAAKHTMRTSSGLPDARDLILSTRAARDALITTNDHREALEAFAQGRRPVFMGA